ncbi:MAG: cupredoxin domain-containing protein [Candidatus Eisenbacteria bacterium]|uniref:Cupredoxin domain-containing protein n=1 Tax=Eiseniibacteriota bacterium TaxID=2212470 RepID=A0A933WAI7_UNCEI|nr:cupredoxin domain-containing protein [Candidatus Eisenbacteria bacterium]
MKRILFACTAVLIAAASFTATPARAAKPKEQRVFVSVTAKGFEPANIPVKAGKPIVLVVTRKTDRTCATEVVMKSPAINVPLPLNKPVEIKLAAQKPGTLRFACAMDMITGQLVVN